MDKITEKRIETLHPKIRAMVREIYAKINANLVNKNIICRFTSTYRTAKEQNELYAQGRTTNGNVVTMAKAGWSYHNYGLAIDVCLIKNGVEASWEFSKDFDGDGIADLMEVIRIFESYGWEWAGGWKRFKEKPHIQFAFGKSIVDLQKQPTFIQDNIVYPVL